MNVCFFFTPCTCICVCDYESDLLFYSANKNNKQNKTSENRAISMKSKGGLFNENNFTKDGSFESLVLGLKK